MTDVKKKTRIKKRYKILLIVLAVLIIFRLFLPTIVLHYVNKSLANMKGYYGHVDDIDISLYRGAYQINDIYINELDEKTKKQTEFFKANNIDLSVEWGALIHGRLVGELEFNTPKLVFTRNRTEIGDVKKDTNDFRKILKDFMPLKVNRFEVNNGSVHYVDKTSSPKVDVAIVQAHILAKNLTNAAKHKEVLPATIVADAKAYEGTVSFNMKLDPLAERTAFDMNAEVKNTNLVKLNDFLKAYANVDVNRGTLGLYTEFVSNKGKYKGYVKPVLKDLDVLGPEDNRDNFFHKIWEGLVGLAANVLENPKKDQVATKIPIEGDINGGRTDILDTIFSLLRNAFIQALVPSIDNQISLRSLAESEKKKGGFFKRLFSDGKKDEKTNKQKAPPAK